MQLERGIKKSANKSSLEERTHEEIVIYHCAVK